ncbi:SDR family NAD(P)-dependent oxidoreductase [Pseudomaricurvus alkylphenolicus]|uniref:SDR family NAD(P)-dependent oxidoreductase n=1 Tax=Pseudomaricurvus alkylphenolicus TaxID=1306991 RepID=UPI00142402E8|nr:SDR family NAD(P)-dependent oxidoreductase [Pseudomaricurvus alkylphenolicus]NIB44102.1 SDR family NAD(P)-dependent oxidoreductase [Pseudomaricurvus alkylphenolicus]
MKISINTSFDTTTLLERYGPWALIIGASHGTGSAAAHQLAAEGINCVLLARNESALDELSQELQQRYGIDTRCIVADLSQPDSTNEALTRVEDLDIGLLIYNAGAPAYASDFIKAPLETWQNLIALGATSLTTICYHIAQKMVERGRGGILLMGSHAALGGNKKYALYTASKGFMLNFGESLWMELKDMGVDVLNFLILVVDTPTLRKQMRKSNVDGWDNDRIPGVYSPHDVMQKALQELPNGPTFLHPDDDEHESDFGSERRAALIERWSHTEPYVGDD